jgi:hypothetical protein
MAIIFTGHLDGTFDAMDGIDAQLMASFHLAMRAARQGAS